MLNTIKNWLSGKKTYITGICAVLTGLVAWSTGEISGQELVVAVYAALQTIWLRAGIRKNGS